MKTYMILVLAVLALALAGCGKEKRENRLPTVEELSLYNQERASTAPLPAEDDRELASAQEAEYAPMTYTDKGFHYADQGADAVWDGSNWLGLKIGIGMELILILSLPYILIFSIPGVLAGRAEKLVEGAAICGVGVFFACVADGYLTSSESSLALVAPIWGLVIPGAFLFFWGVVSEREEGKMGLLLTCSGSLAIYLGCLAWKFLIIGLVSWGLVTIIVLILLGALGVKVGRAFAD
jgi:hypothetical protein